MDNRRLSCILKDFVYSHFLHFIRCTSHHTTVKSIQIFENSKNVKKIRITRKACRYLSISQMKEDSRQISD